jgi:hypothetical protein
MARTVGTESLADLIRRGALQPDERLIVRRRSAPPVEGTLLANGTIRIRQRTFPTPTMAAKYALEVGSVDGWIRWRVPRLDNATLAEVRGR